MATSNAEGDSAAAAERERKRKRESGEASLPQWRTEIEQKRYSTKLLEALRRVRPAADAPPRNRAVREAADRVLAVAARGRTRWSRAILSTRSIKLKAARKRRPAIPGRPKKAVPGTGTGSSALLSSKKGTPVLQRKAMVLGRLVPGCRKLSLPTLLEEATDYIAALQMQVRAMTSLTQILSVSGAGAGASPSDRSGPSEQI